LGETRYRSAADMIPGDIAVRIEQALKLAGLAAEPPPRPPPQPDPVSGPSVAPPPVGAGATFFDKDAAAEAEAAAGPGAAQESAAPVVDSQANATDDGDDSLSGSPFATLDSGLSAKPAASEAPPLPPESPADELVRLRAEVKGLQSELDETKTRAADAEDAWRAHDATRKEVVAQNEELDARVASLQADVKAGKKGREKDRSDHEARVTEFKIDLDAARTTPLRDLFEDRGLEHPEEFGQALEFFLQEERSGPSIRALRVQGPDKFSQKLKTRLMLWCGDGECPTTHPEEGRVIVSPPARCETCKGKTIRRAAAGFVEACRSGGVKRVTIAGGSPNYRTAIQEAIGAALDIRVVLNGERNASQAGTDVEHSELVIAWVATEVDHKFTGLYTDLKSKRVVLCPHRGISRMFHFATDHIKAGKVTGAPEAAPPV
jgi:hypothetical protein